MSDDIVDRLRHDAASVTHRPSLESDFNLAADEIMRLRERVTELEAHCVGHWNTAAEWCRSANEMLEQRNAERALADQLAEELRYIKPGNRSFSDRMADAALAAYDRARNPETP